jgi:hypothetical protein
MVRTLGCSPRDPGSIPGAENFFFQSRSFLWTHLAKLFLEDEFKAWCVTIDPYHPDLEDRIQYLVYFFLKLYQRMHAINPANASECLKSVAKTIRKRKYQPIINTWITHVRKHEDDAKKFKKGSGKMPESIPKNARKNQRVDVSTSQRNKKKQRKQNQLTIPR